jgi:ATP-binding cassette subfamily B protein/subfamily B ATP-binding cassette protein MsbA
MLIKNPILLICYFGVLIYISWELTLFTLVVLPIMGWAMGRIGRKLKRQSLDAQNKWSETMSQLEETLGGMRIIKAFTAEKKMQERFERSANEFRHATNRVVIRQASAHPVSEFLGTCLIVLVLWYGGTLIFSENPPVDAPTFIFYLVILYSIIQPLKDLSKASYNIPKGMASVERVNKILHAENPIRQSEHPVHLPQLKQEIEFRNISFSYNGKNNVLTDVNFTVKRGQTIAIVGQSGSGKSTLVDLLPRYHDVTGGQILVDGVDVKNIYLSDLRALIGNVNQEAILFNDSFYNNIAFGVENATMEQVIEAAKIANAHDFIMESEQGYDTPVGDRGCRLSGGQRQRISIARAILKNPAILILDEATSALDTESERLVQEALERLMKTRTTIAIAHRLSTIKNADEICVLYEGRIVERGTRDALLAKNGYYKRLNDMQQL